MEKTRFTLTEDHIKLLRHMYVSWDEYSLGAPAIDSKRPYGNSDDLILSDVARILEWKTKFVSGTESHGLSKKQVRKAKELHEGTQLALQIVLSTGKFEPGVYEMDDFHMTEWRKVA